MSQQYVTHKELVEVMDKLLFLLKDYAAQMATMRKQIAILEFLQADSDDSFSPPPSPHPKLHEDKKESVE